ncbi:MAG: hypothetical protein MJZ82_03660 [Paludibacteraceae bacterium]|nr:hypothetical protein [Paludibacteraceae bacterium]
MKKSIYYLSLMMVLALTSCENEVKEPKLPNENANIPYLSVSDLLPLFHISVSEAQNILKNMGYALFEDDSTSGGYGYKSISSDNEVIAIMWDINDSTKTTNYVFYNGYNKGMNVLEAKEWYNQIGERYEIGETTMQFCNAHFVNSSSMTTSYADFLRMFDNEADFQTQNLNALWVDTQSQYWAGQDIGIGDIMFDVTYQYGDGINSTDGVAVFISNVR